TGTQPCPQPQPPLRLSNMPACFCDCNGSQIAQWELRLRIDLCEVKNNIYSLGVAMCLLDHLNPELTKIKSSSRLRNKRSRIAVVINVARAELPELSQRSGGALRYICKLQLAEMILSAFLRLDMYHRVRARVVKSEGRFQFRVQVASCAVNPGNSAQFFFQLFLIQWLTDF